LRATLACWRKENARRSRAKDQKRFFPKGPAAVGCEGCWGMQCNSTPQRPAYPDGQVVDFACMQLRKTTACAAEMLGFVGSLQGAGVVGRCRLENKQSVGRSDIAQNMGDISRRGSGHSSTPNITNMMSPIAMHCGVRWRFRCGITGMVGDCVLCELELTSPVHNPV
jgi:hypothetical protein